MIKIELTEREKLLLEIGFLGNLSNRKYKRNKFSLEKLVNDTTSGETALKARRDTFGLEKVKRRHRACYKKYKGKCSYIDGAKFPMRDRRFIRKSLLVDPYDIVHTQYSAISGRVGKKIKTIVNLLELYNLKVSTKEELLDWLKAEDHYNAVKMMLDSLIAGMAVSYTECERIINAQPASWLNILKKNLKTIHHFVNAVYDYSGCINTKARYEISCLMKVSVCPYCNRQYITVLNKTEKGTATFDHYYREKTYPIFKLTLYNLVPSCYTCNSVLKGQDNREHLNPWRMKREEIKFDVKLLKGEADILKNYFAGYGKQKYTDAELLVQNGVPGDIETDNSLAVFELQSMYAVHTQYAAQFAAKAQKYERGKYKERLVDKLKAAGFAVDEEMLDRMMYGFPAKVIGTKEESAYAMHMPLYKMKRDLVKKNRGFRGGI